MTIDKLTPEQEAKIPEYLELGRKYGLGIDQYDREKVEASMLKLYAAYGMQPPQFVHAPSPKSGKELAEPGVSPVYGSQELYWLLYYKFINDELPVEKTTEPLDEMLEVCLQTGWFWPGEKVCVITPKPSVLEMRGDRLHCETGPALRWDDGFEVWALNGIRMNRHLDTIKKILDGEVPAKEILSVRNVEERAELIKLTGIDKLFKELKPTKLDTDTFNDCTYELYSVTIYDDNSTAPRIYLKMPNPSVDEIHIEGVHPDCRTVEQALNWRNCGVFDINKGEFVPPMALT